MGNYKKIILEPSLMFIDNRNHTQIYEIAGFWSFNGFIVGCFLREPTLKQLQGEPLDKKLAQGDVPPLLLKNEESDGPKSPLVS